MRNRGPQVFEDAYGNGMAASPVNLDCLIRSLHPRFLKCIRAWSRRSGLARGLSAEDILSRCFGEIWIGLAESENPHEEWCSALRRALYREFEAGRNTLPLVWEPSRNEISTKPLPKEHTSLIAELEADPGHPVRATRERGWSRRTLSVHLTRLVLETHGTTYWDDLRARIARLHIHRVSKETPQKLRELRFLLKIFRFLELPSDLQEADQSLKRRVREIRQADPESQGPPSESAAPHAKEGPEST